MSSGVNAPFGKKTSADEFGLSNDLLFAQRANSACRKACFLPSGGIRLAEGLAFCPAEEFGLLNAALFCQRVNSVRRMACFSPSGRIRLAERLAFALGKHRPFGFSAKLRQDEENLFGWRSLFAQRTNSACRKAHFCVGKAPPVWVFGKIAQFP